MQIEEERIVTLSYTLRENDASGNILEIMDQHYPFKFMYGSGQLLPAFEKALHGLSEGQSFECTLDPTNAYGPKTTENIIDVPLEVFKKDGSLQESLLEIGKYVTLNDDQGNSYNGLVLERGETVVKIDFNHTMAGKTLYFKGVVLNIRLASKAELERQSYIESGGVRQS